jgi:hypothetical protein
MALGLNSASQAIATAAIEANMTRSENWGFFIAGEIGSAGA